MNVAADVLTIQVEALSAVIDDVYAKHRNAYEHTGAESHAMTVSASPDSSSCGTWPKAYVASAFSVNVQITS